MIGNGMNIKSMSFVGNVVAFMQYCLTNYTDGYHLFNYVDKPDLNTNQLVELIAKSSGRKVQSIKIPYAIGYLAGLGFDLLSKITGKEFSISSVRIKKFCSTTQFSNQQIAATNFKPTYTLEEGLDITIKSLL